MAHKQTIEQLTTILGRVEYKDWMFHLTRRGDWDDYDVVLQVEFYAPDNEKGGEPVLQKGRKWFLSRYSCPTEVIQTAWAAVHRAELHEIQEQFLYRGQSIWNNHVDVDALVEISERIDQREAPRTAEYLTPKAPSMSTGLTGSSSAIYCEVIRKGVVDVGSSEPPVVNPLREAARLARIKLDKLYDKATVE
jgi:hypothetical protein